MSMSTRAGRSLGLSLVLALLAGLLVSLPPTPARATASGPDGELVVSIYTTEYRVFTLNPDEINPGLDSVKAGIETTPPGTNIHPTWSPNGRIAYADFHDDNGDRSRIYTILPGGTGKTLLDSDRGADTQPAWSPDGQRIAFTTTIGGGAAAPCTNGGPGGSIAYAMAGDIYKTDRTGSTSQQLTNTSDFEGAPNWRADGSKIGFWRQTTKVGMYEMDPDGNNQTALTPAVGEDQYGPVFSPDGTKVLYTAFDTGMMPDVWVRDLASGSTTNLTNDPAMDTSPEWSCDGSRVIFASDRGGNRDIYTVKADGTDLVQLTNTSWNEDEPTYSPDGTKIAYRSDQHGDYDIMVMTSNGSNANDPLHLTTSSNFDNGPSWSPDGKEIVYASGSNSIPSDLYTIAATTPDSHIKITNTSGSETAPDWGPSTGETFIYTMKPDGTDPQKVTLPITGGYPAWSPDASRIVFSDSGDLFTISPNGLGLERLTADHNNTGTDIEPSWSPDGSKVAYAGVGTDGRSSIYTVNVAGGTGLTNVTMGTADRSPVWSPSGTRIAFIRNGDIYTIKPDGTDLKLIKELSDDSRFISLDWGTGGPPDTIITKKPGEAVGDNQATFQFRASRYPASFECRLSSNNGWAGLHDYKDCGSMPTADSAEPVFSYSGLAKGHYTFYVRAFNEHGTDETPASWQFESFPPGLTVTKDGNGTGTVTSSPDGIKCGPSKTECSSDKFSGKTVELTAQADKGSDFVKWTGACSGTNKKCTVKVGNKPVFVNARFDLNSTGGYCNEAPETTKQVGPWYLTGCWKKSGSTFTTTEPIKLDGLNLLPKGSTLTLDPAGQTLASSGVVQLNAGPVTTSAGHKLGPITLFNDQLDMDLSEPTLLTFMPDTTVLDMPVIPLAALEAENDGVTVSINAEFPAVLGSGNGLLKFFSDRSGGLKWNSFRFGRYTESGTTNMEYPFAGAIGQIFALDGVTITYVPGRGWVIDGTVVMAGGPTGTLNGTLNYANGAYTGGSFTLSNVALGGVVFTPKVRFDSADGFNWSVAEVSAASGRQALQAGGAQDCGSAINGQFQADPDGTLKNMALSVPGQCELWGQALVVNNLNLQATTFTIPFTDTDVPNGLALSGDLAGQATGAVTGNVSLNVAPCLVPWANQDFSCVPPVTGVTLNSPQMTFADDILSANNLVVNGVPDASGTGWDIDGTGDLVTDWYGDGAVTFDANVQGTDVSYARLIATDYGMFEVQDQSTGETKPLIRLKNLALTYVPSQNIWGIDGNVDLPGASVSGITGAVVLDAAGQVKKANIDINYAKLVGYIEVNDAHLTYMSPRSWGGDVTVVLPGVIEVAGVMGVKNNELEALGAEVTFGQPLPIALVPGTGVYRVQFSLNKNPLTVGGGLGIQAGPTLFGIRPITADGNFTARFPGAMQDPGFRVDGDVKVMNLQLGEGYLDYTHPKAIDVAGCLGDCDDGLKLGPAKVVGFVEGKYRSQPFAFQVSGGAEAGMAWNCQIFNWNCGTVDVKILGKAILSNIGAAVCGGFQGWSTDWTGGIGYKWNGTPAAFKGCDLGPYKSIKNASLLIARGVSGADGSVHRIRTQAAADLPVKAFRFTGEDAPPLVDVHRPNGEVISMSPETVGQHDDYLIFVDPDANETIILVDKPESGVWSVTLQEGSSPLKSASDSDGLEPAEVTAAVSGDGATRTLSWELTPIEGQTVRFVETADDTSQVIAETSEATGSVEFTPAPGLAGTRTIVAEVIQNGLPRDSIEVATYEAPERNVLVVSVDGKGKGSVLSDPAGIDCGDTCEMDLTGEVTLTATSAAGSRFVGWSGACGGTATCTITPDQSNAVTATFAKYPKPVIERIKPGRAKVGTKVTIIGKGFTDATEVRFGKKAAASFKVVSDTKITVKVPKGAKSGTVTVTGPGGTGKSKKRFVVIKG